MTATRPQRRMAQAVLLAALAMFAGAAAIAYQQLQASPEPSAPAIGAHAADAVPAPAPPPTLAPAPASPPAPAPLPIPAGIASPAHTAASQAPAPGTRVVVHVPDGAAAAALATKLLAALKPGNGRLETRHVASSPSRPSIRYFRRQDETAARSVAGRMAGAGLTWTVQDFTAFTPRPSAGTVEVWLPSQP